ncbi:MAG: DUF1365 domain-containing protein [Nitratireductor sp.]
MKKIEQIQEKPNDAPISIYNGKVMHARLKPVLHRFSYKMASILIDLDRLEDAGKCSLYFSINSPNVISFYERHHGARNDVSLRTQVEEMLASQNIERPHKIQLLCYPSVLGYTFNPLSVYFCFDSKNQIKALIYQVNNTFGESHSYIIPVSKNKQSIAGIRQQANKAFYVSPFIDMDMKYWFRVKAPSKEVAIRILETDKNGPLLSATFYGKHLIANGTNFAKIIFQTMGIAWKATIGIHYEALKLWAKGLKVRKRVPIKTIIKH